MAIVIKKFKNVSFIQELSELTFYHENFPVIISNFNVNIISQITKLINSPMKDHTKDFVSLGYCESINYDLFKAKSDQDYSDTIRKEDVCYFLNENNSNSYFRSFVFNEETLITFVNSIVEKPDILN